jgi:cystathionine gamma-synthase
MRTLALRVREACANALAIAGFLEDHPKVERVLYPGLASHPRHALAGRQMDGGFGGLMSFQVRGDADAALAVAGRLRLIARATSLGGTESVIEHRFTIEGAATGVPPNLLRLSVGIEDPGDLVADLAQALE